MLWLVKCHTCCGVQSTKSCGGVQCNCDDPFIAFMAEHLIIFTPVSSFVYITLSLSMHLLSVITCEDLGNNVENGFVEYSTPVEQAEGRYRLNTTATVTCDTGFTGGSDITCGASGEWTAPSLPTCKNCESVKKTYTQTRAQLLFFDYKNGYNITNIIHSSKDCVTVTFMGVRLNAQFGSPGVLQWGAQGCCNGVLNMVARIGCYGKHP